MFYSTVLAAEYFCFYEEIMRTYYHNCEYCGSNLDPGEHCNCQNQIQDTQPKIDQNIANEMVRNLRNVDTDLFFDILSENYSVG